MTANIAILALRETSNLGPAIASRQLLVPKGAGGVSGQATTHGRLW